MKRLSLIIPMFTLVLVLFAVGCSFFVLSEAELAYNDGIAYSKLGQHQRAIQDYDHAIKLNPDYAYAYCNRGMAYMDLRQLERAIQDCDQGIKLRRRPGHRFEIGLCRSLLQGEPSKAQVDQG